MSTDDIVHKERQRDARLRVFAYTVLSILAVAAVVVAGVAVAVFRRDHVLLKNSVDQRTQILGIARNTQAVVDRLDGIVSGQPEANAAIANVIADLEAELAAVCAATHCHGIPLRPFAGVTETTTRPAATRSTTTTTTSAGRGTTTTSPSSTTTTRPSCITLPNQKCLTGGASANDHSR